MGLAGPSNKERIGFDPRNTTWSNDTSRFGHQYLRKLGWTPGSGLGSSVKGSTNHITVKAKTDNVGLGKSSAAVIPTGLNVYQRILSRLNGNEEQANRQLIEEKKLTGEFLNFVPGGTLEGTVQKLVDKMAKDAAQEGLTQEKRHKQSRKDSEHKTNPKLKDKKDKDKSKKDKRGKKEHKHNRTTKNDEQPQIRITSSKTSKVEKTISDKKPKHKASVEEPVETVALKTAASAPPKMRGIRAMRSRYIAMKQQATQDSKGLREVLMLPD